MPLTFRMRMFLFVLRLSGFNSLHQRSVTALRQSVAGGPMTLLRRSRKAGADERDIEAPGPGGPLAMRLYRAEGPAPHPLLVFFHGGGFIMGTLDMYDALCRALSRGARCAVLSVDYRLAPEHPFPAAVDDALFALRWARDHAASLDVDPSRLAVAGDSAGGNLAAVAAQGVRDAGDPPLCGQVLIYPVLDHEARRYASCAENGSGYMLTARDMAWLSDLYFPAGAHRDDPRASPLRATTLAGLAPAFIVTAQYDPLRDQGIAYAQRLQAAGVAVTLSNVPGVIHGFVSMAAFIPEGRAAIRQICDWLAGSFALRRA